MLNITHCWEKKWDDTYFGQNLEGSLQTTPLILRPSLLKYNSRMAQTTQWLQAIQNCMKKVRLRYPSLPVFWGVIK